MTTPATIEERVSRIEGGQEHFATKADVESVRVDLERLRSEFKEEMGKLRTEIRDSKISTIIWIAGIMVVITTAQTAAGLAILRLLNM